MAILADTIKKLLTKAGFDTESESYRKLIGLKELVVDIPDDVDSSLTSLMGLTEAKNNIDIKKHYKAEVLDPFNNKLPIWLKELGADDDMIKAIIEDPNTYNKVENGLRKIAELKSKAAESGSKGDKAELEKKVNELSAQLSKVVSDKDKEKEDSIAAITNKYETDILNQERRSIVSTKQLPGLFDVKAEIDIANGFVDKKLAEIGAVLKRVDGKIKILNKDDEKIPIFVNGNELDISTLTDMALADNKFLKVSGDGGGNPPTPKPGAQAPKLNSAASTALSGIDDALKAVGG